MFGEHLLGLYEKALDPMDDWENRLRKAKELGFDYMEISIDESDERLQRLDWSREQIESLRRISYEVGVPIQSMCLSAHRRFPFGSADPTVRARAHEIMERAIDFAVAMGIRVIQLAGYDVYYEPSTPQSVRLFREAMLWSARKAAQKQIMLGMEIMDTAFMNSMSKHMAYESMIRSPWYHVYTDLGNISAWPENDVEYEFEHGVNSIVAIHLKDTIAVTREHPGVFKCVPFGAGCVDFCARFRQLERLHYTGPYMIEMWYDPENKDDMQPVREAKNWLQAQYCAAAGES